MKLDSSLRVSIAAPSNLYWKVGAGRASFRHSGSWSGCGGNLRGFVGSHGSGKLEI